MLRVSALVMLMADGVEGDGLSMLRMSNDAENVECVP